MGLHRSIALLLALAFVALAARPALGQLSEGTMNIVQAGKRAGAVFRPAGQDPCDYLEYWYLDAGYRYGAPTLEPSPARFATVEEFVHAQQRIDPKGKLVVARAMEPAGQCGPAN